MELAQTKLVVWHQGKGAQVDGTRIRFSAHQCFAREGGEDDSRCLGILAVHLAAQPGLAVCIDGDGAFLRYFLTHVPNLRERIQCVIVEKYSVDAPADVGGIPLVVPAEIPASVQTIFLCETRTLPRMRMRKWLDASQEIRLIEPDVVADLAPDQLPSRAWTPWARDVIYPIDVPDIEFEEGLDLLVIDCPARNLGLMPNGLGYVHNALQQVDVRFQTCDIDILIYHRFHIRRLCDEGGEIALASGRKLPSDPWQAEHYDLWCDDTVIAYFEQEIDEIVAKIIAVRPKVLGLSIHGCNERFSAKVVERVKKAVPEMLVLVGGYACYSPDIGLRGFPLADYMCIGEADLTVGPLVERLAGGERPGNVPGVLSKYDTPGAPFVPAPMVHDLDLLDHPKYEWNDLGLYHNYNGYQLVPIIASRGCRWSRCTFCAERFYWRIRSPTAFVDELAWLVERGCRLFMFNESDLNGKPEVVLEICDEIIRRGLKVKLTGQLRIHKKCDLVYFKKLRQAGFVALRFGIDAFSENTLRLQKKGYTTATVSQNLKDCWEAGIFSEVNWVIGVPGETDEDIDQSIALILKNQRYIGRLANINPLILVTGGVYWLEPEKHNIHFRGDKEELYEKYPRAIPAHLWYSTEPYIDEKVRKARFERIVLALHEGGFPVGVWANRVIEDVKQNRDPNRAGPKEESAPTATKERGKTSAGIGGMEKPKPPKTSDLEFNADARSSSYVFRAGSSLPEDKAHSFQSCLYLVAYKNELFGIEPASLRSALGSMPHALAQMAGRAERGATLDARACLNVSLAKSKDAVPELLESVGCYNIVAYDARYYGVPQHIDQALARLIVKRLRANGSNPKALRRSRLVKFARAAVRTALDWTMRKLPGRKGFPVIGSIPWGDLDLEGLPGVIVGSELCKVIDDAKAIQGLGRDAQRPTAAPRQAASTMALPVVTAGEPAPREAGAQRRPHLVGTLEDYNVVEYEGWYYGIPQALGEVRLQDVDVIEMPGVIRDVSREVVEGEIRELCWNLPRPRS